MRLVPKDRARHPYVGDFYRCDIEASIQSPAPFDFVTTGALATFSDQTLLGGLHLLFNPIVDDSRLLLVQLAARSKESNDGGRFLRLLLPLECTFGIEAAELIPQRYGVSMKGLGLRKCLIETEVMTRLTVHFEGGRLHVHPSRIQAVASVTTQVACVSTGLRDSLPHVTKMAEAKARVFFQLSAPGHTTPSIAPGVGHQRECKLRVILEEVRCIPKTRRGVYFVKFSVARSAARFPNIHQSDTSVVLTVTVSATRAVVRSEFNIRRRVCTHLCVTFETALIPNAFESTVAGLAVLCDKTMRARDRTAIPGPLPSPSKQGTQEKGTHDQNDRDPGKPPSSHPGALDTSPCAFRELCALVTAPLHLSHLDRQIRVPIWIDNLQLDMRDPNDLPRFNERRLEDDSVDQDLRRSIALEMNSVLLQTERRVSKRDAQIVDNESAVGGTPDPESCRFDDPLLSRLFPGAPPAYLYDLNLHEAYQ